MAVQYITERWLRGLKPPESGRVQYHDTNVKGLILRVTASGNKTWAVLYKIKPDRNWRIWTIGRYPAYSLAQARQLARDALYAAQRGEDVAQQQKDEREAPTFADLVTEYLDKYASKKKSGHLDKDLLENEALPRWKRWKAHEVQRRHVIALLDEIKERAPIRANRALAHIRKLYNWGISRDLVSSNPCWGVSAPSKENRRDRVLSASEIEAVWTNLEKARMAKTTRFALKLMLTTAQRAGEVLSAKWSEFDLDGGWWTIPAEKAKNGLAHRVPLTAFAISLLNEISNDSEFLFPSPRGESHIEVNALAQAVRVNLQALGVPKFTPHDLRRTAASHMTGNGTPRLVVAKILNHAESGVTAVYDRHSYDAEKRRALEKWSSVLQGIISGSKDKVVPMRSA